jgi:acetyltransferase-like isoleucine patch superfamily enzyme
MVKDKMGRNLTTVQVIQKANNRLVNIFLDFELMCIRIAGQIPSHLIRLFIYRLSGMEIGDGSRIHMWANFFNPQGITVGKDTIIGDHVFLDGRAKITIGNHVDIASSVMIYSSSHDVDSEDFRAQNLPVVIGDYVFIGPRVIILPGVQIGKGAVVAAGAVVTKEVAPFTVVGGVPAEFIRERRNKNPRYKLGRARLFQ